MKRTKYLGNRRAVGGGASERRQSCPFPSRRATLLAGTLCSRNSFKLRFPRLVSSIHSTLACVNLLCSDRNTRQSEAHTKRSRNSWRRNHSRARLRRTKNQAWRRPSLVSPLLCMKQMLADKRSQNLLESCVMGSAKHGVSSLGEVYVSTSGNAVNFCMEGMVCCCSYNDCYWQ